MRPPSCYITCRYNTPAGDTSFFNFRRVAGPQASRLDQLGKFHIFLQLEKSYVVVLPWRAVVGMAEDPRDGCVGRFKTIM